MCLCGVLAVALAGKAAAQIAILQIKVVEGEGAVYAPGSHAAHPITVEVTDETGKPVEGAAVSFHLPDDGPGGSFANGLHTDVVMTDARGRAALHSLAVNRIGGRFQIRIVASKEQAHAGIISFQYVAEPKGGSGSSGTAPPATAKSNHRALWIVVAALAGGGAAAAGILSSHSGQNPPAGNTGGATPPVISIGAPTITVGKP